MWRLAILAAAATPLAACNDIVCGEGTYADGDTCIGYDPNDATAPVTTADPPGGRGRAALPESVVLTSDEPARIYVTTDGSDPDPATTPGETSPVTVVDITQGMTLKWIAVDRAGNREEIKSTIFDSDTTPPTPPSAFTVTMNGTTAQVAWANPADGDFAGTAVARVSDVVDVLPTDGMVVGPGMLSSSVQVLQVGTGTTLSDPGRLPGPTRYVAWSYDDLGNYSAPVIAGASLPIGTLTAQLTYDTAANTLAMPTVPENISLTGTTATLSGTTLTVSLKLTNNTTRYFHNFKAEVTSATNATYTSSDGTADGFPFESFGPNLFGPGASVTRDLVFTVTAGTVATIDLTLTDHATLVFAHNQRSQQIGMIDLGSGQQRTTLTTTIRGPQDRATGQARIPVLTGGRYLDIPHTHGAVERFDLTTGMRTAFAPLGIGDKVNVNFLIPRGGELIACIKTGGKRNDGPLEMVRLDESLKIRQRVPLVGATEQRGFTFPALHPNGRTLAIAVTGGVALFDLVTMTQVDADPSSPTTIDIVRTGLSERSRGVVFFNNGDGMLVLTKFNGRAAIVEKGVNGWVSTLYQDAITGRNYGMSAVPGGKIWIAVQSAIREFDPATKQFTTIAYPNLAYGINVIEDKIWVTRQDKITHDQVSATGAVQRTITLPTASRAVGHWIRPIR